MAAAGVGTEKAVGAMPVRARWEWRRERTKAGGWLSGRGLSRWCVFRRGHEAPSYLLVPDNIKKGPGAAPATALGELCSRGVCVYEKPEISEIRYAGAGQKEKNGMCRV